MIEAIGISAHAGPESRRIQPISGGRRGAATTPACTASMTASDGTKASAMLPRVRGAHPGKRRVYEEVELDLETLLERLKLLVQLGRELVSEGREVLLHLGQLGSPALVVDLQQLGHRLG